MAKNNNLKNNAENNFKFDEAYNKEKWALHFGESFQEEYGAISNEDEILEKHSDFLEKVIWIGDLNTDNNETIGVYEVYIKNTNLASRVKISRLCSKIITGGERNTYGKGIFFILYNDKKNNYRVSYVKHDKVAVLGNKDVRVKKDYSNPKRYTFLLGEGIKVHTPESRLKSDIFNSVESIENAFSVEPVNKEFYNGVKEYFDNIYKDVIKYFNKDENRAKEFALRFLGRILFCWFLREKELIPSEILNSKVFENLKYKKNYYSDVLEDLFFNVLNIDMEKRSFSKDRVISNYEKEIPFLNGGLFSKKEDDEAVTIIDDDIVKGLFEFFEMYNFTVDESAPFDVEISIDPEMLGRIFENLLAEINPETKESARKETGSFYTPREIVDYMVMEAIKLYLYKKLPDIKDKIDRIFDIEDSIEYSDKERESILKNIHDMIILDPACGSGAFPLGILQRVFNVIDKLDPKHEYYKDYIINKLPSGTKEEFKKLYDAKKFSYAYKLDILQSMIHGVDIQPIAVEVSKLRAFLSLVVDEKKTDDKNDNFGIKTLPNLEFQFICANTLVPLEVNSTEELFIKGHIENLKKSIKNYFNIHDKEDKKVAENDIEAFFEQIERDENLESATKRLICSWHPFKNKAALYFDSELQFGLERNFDIVIGNPPYLEARNSIFTEEMKNNYQNDIINNFPKYKHLLGKGMDLSLYFYIKGSKLITEDGLICFVCTNSWLSTKYGISFQKFLLENNSNIILIDTDFKQFNTAAINTIISFVSPSEKSSLTLKYYKDNFSDSNKKYCYTINDKELLSNYKWSILFNDNLNILLSILEKMSKGLTVDKVGLKYGQGLNGYKVNDKGNIPFYHKEKPNFSFSNFTNKIYELKTKRTPPIFIMPRGIAYSHYCCFNRVKAYSDSYVEISGDENYLDVNKLDDKNLISIWLFYNSTLGWLLREITGRNNLGGGLLKAEAFDLQNIPCIFDIDLKKGKALYKKVENINILNYNEEINTEHHKEIDNIIFDSINLNEKERSYIISKFIEVIEQRKSKSNTNKV